MSQIVVPNEKELAGVANKIWNRLGPEAGRRAIVIALEGPLGAGKTTLVKNLAKTMLIDREVVSPTFVLHIPYPIPNKPVILEHIDAWRLENEEELLQLGWKKMIENKSIIVVEWADRVRNVLERHSNAAHVMWVTIMYGAGEQERRISVDEKADFVPLQKN